MEDQEMNQLEMADPSLTGAKTHRFLTRASAALNALHVNSFIYHTNHYHPPLYTSETAMVK